MDAREMKKQILFEALDQLIHDDSERIVRLIVDTDNITEALLNRYRKVINEMHENARVKAFPDSD